MMHLGEAASGGVLARGAGAAREGRGSLDEARRGRLGDGFIGGGDR
jgi:hypothetical protein